jgi:hypothetical protein
MLVTLPEETPVNELVETAYSLEDEVGISLGPVVVNGMYPEIPGLATDPDEAAKEAGAYLHPGEARAMRRAARFRLDRMELQAEQIARLADTLPLPQLQLPYLFSTDLDRDDIELLSGHLSAGIENLVAIPAEPTEP